MAVSIKAKFTKADVQKMVQQQAEKLEKAVLSGLQRVGEKFVSNARNKGSYKDRTGNLRSSAGYVILKNGIQLTGMVNDLNRKVINEVAAKYPKGYVLIGVAGMNYAAAVEAKGKDVISASVLIAGTDLNQMMNQIKSKL